MTHLAFRHKLFVDVIIDGFRVELRSLLKSNGYRAGLLATRKGIGESTACLGEALVGIPRAGHSETALPGIHTTDGPYNAARLDHYFLRPTGNRHSESTRGGGVINSQDVGGAIRVSGHGIVEARSLCLLLNLYAASLQGYGACGWFGFAEGQKDCLKRSGIMEAQDVLALGKVPPIGSLVLRHFGGGVASMPPVADEELLCCAIR